LDASDVDASQIEALATRADYPSAADHLVHVVEQRPGGNSNLVGTLYTSAQIDRVLIFRIAQLTGAAPMQLGGNYTREAATLEWLQELAKKRGQKAESARVALAILGEPVAPWCELSRRERAGLLLGMLVAAWRERSP
jgi:hypothetical protein